MKYVRNRLYVLYSVTLFMAVLIVGLWLTVPCYGQEQEGHIRQPLPSSEEISMLPIDGGPEFNRLIHEKSPYLLQHARNPVNWYSWGPEAFEQARKENKPIFLSIGYSTCHWCHVMERESFEREDVAEIMNKYFISIKVDREERPDIDEIYMNATNLIVGRGGWPNSLWLTPDRKPFYAGTYFPREDKYGRTGFKTILLRLAQSWENQRGEVEAQADRITTAMKDMAENKSVKASGDLNRELVKRAEEQIAGSFDKSLGGFGGAPKFPPHQKLMLLINQYRKTKDEKLLVMVRKTADSMADGGIHDHIGGGFHRYSTDNRWFLPHFEKMLYDNAQLARFYVDMYLITKDQRYREVAEGILNWVLRDMTDKDGGFYSALDADSEGEEGKYYLWGHDEVVNILGSEEAERFARIYSFEKKGNYRDQAAGKRPGTNIVYLKKPLKQAAKTEKLTLENLQKRLKKNREKLLSVRNKRIWPSLDDKVLADWNGLMIGSFAYAGKQLQEQRYIKAAKRAANFILKTMRKDGRIIHRYREGEAKLDAYLDDYAFLADGLLELYDATGDKQWLDETKALVEVLFEHYQDKEGAFFHTADDHEKLLLRTKEPYDRAIPSGNGVAAVVLVRLGRITGNQKYLEQARRLLSFFLGFMERAPAGTSTMMIAVDQLEDIKVSSTETGEKPKAQLRKRPVTLQVFASDVTVKPGQTIKMSIKIDIDEGYHINSSQPLTKKLIATSVSLKKLPQAAIETVSYPKGKEMKLKFSPEPLSVYEESVNIKFAVTIAKDAKEGKSNLEIEVRTQACTETFCLAPETHVLSIPIQIEPKIK
ncbi:MAG: DUF255 domain-containing protein [Planctomycetes bacterium]|nr:DUF255 domain-containing protein [Planctomycetota bacterium]